MKITLWRWTALVFFGALFFNCLVAKAFWGMLFSVVAFWLAGYADIVRNEEDPP